jgi:hypothetical protein
LRCVLFGGKAIEGRIHFAQSVIERAVGAVARTKGEAFNMGSRIPAKFGVEFWKAPSPQALRDQGGAGSLAETQEQFAPEQVDVFERLAGPTQSNVPRKVTCEPKLTLVFGVVKAAWHRAKGSLPRLGLPGQRLHLLRKTIGTGKTQTPKQERSARNAWSAFASARCSGRPGFARRSSRSRQTISCSARLMRSPIRLRSVSNRASMYARYHGCERCGAACELPEPGRPEEAGLGTGCTCIEHSASVAEV